MFKRMGLGLFRGNKLGYGLSCTDHLAFHGEKTGKNRMMVIFWYFNGSGVCGSAVTPRQMILPSTSIPGFTFSTDGNHKDKQDVGFSLSYRYRAVFVMSSLWLLSPGCWRAPTARECSSTNIQMFPRRGLDCFQHHPERQLICLNKLRWYLHALYRTCVSQHSPVFPRSFNIIAHNVKAFV